MGRWMSPDYSDVADGIESVPYADKQDPQSLNLYSYGGNKPLSQVDATGHYHCDPDTFDSKTNTLTAGACHLDWSDYVDFFRHMTRADAKEIGWGIAGQTIKNLYGNSNCPKCSYAVLPFGMVGGGAKSIVSVIEEEPGAISFVVNTANGNVEVMANTAKEGDKLVLSQVHVSGEGMGVATTKQAARELGARAGVSGVVVEGGTRTGGAAPGHVPASFTVKVNP